MKEAVYVYKLIHQLQFNLNIFTNSTRPNPPIPRVVTTVKSLSSCSAIHLGVFLEILLILTKFSLDIANLKK